MINIIAIIGPAGAGKDTAAQILSQLTDLPVIVSYTTRPMREGEVDGREHFFVSECNVKPEDLLAYTEYGGYEYWTTLQQVEQSAIYVIDEDGYLMLRKQHPDINVIAINLRASIGVRRARGISRERILRDNDRNNSANILYQFIVYNNQHIQRLERELRYVAFKINNTLNK